MEPFSKAMNKNTISTKTTPAKHHRHRHHRSPLSSLCFRKLSIFHIATGVFVFVFVFVILEIQSLQTAPTISLPSSSAFIYQLQNLSAAFTNATCSNPEAADDKLRRAVTFLPLKDLRYAKTAEDGHTWFMSSLYDKQEEGEVQYQQFPSEASKGRLICIKGRDTHDGAWNSYALAWPETLPYNATLMKGLTFVSNNHYDYGNLWHGLMATMPFVAWHTKIGCSVGPTRWVLFHRGELRTKMGSWNKNLMEATFSGPLDIEGFDFGGGGGGDGAVCFEEAVVMRHGNGGMLRQRRMEVYDFIRCKAREYCNVSSVAVRAAAAGGGGGGRGVAADIGMTLLMRTGARSFRNETVVVGIFEKECHKVEGCRLAVAHADNLTFCEQVKLMSMTDILVSPHGAQLTNIFLMDRNSSVMEFFPKGWLKLAGLGQYVYQSIASWSGMNHRGAWRDPDGVHCPYPDDDPRCMTIFKSGKIGYNETYFGEWARDVLNDVKHRKLGEENENSKGGSESASRCACS